MSYIRILFQFIVFIYFLPGVKRSRQRVLPQVNDVATPPPSGK